MAVYRPNGSCLSEVVVPSAHSNDDQSLPSVSTIGQHVRRMTPSWSLTAREWPLARCARTKFVPPRAAPTRTRSDRREVPRRHRLGGPIPWWGRVFGGVRPWRRVSLQSARPSRRKGCRWSAVWGTWDRCALGVADQKEPDHRDEGTRRERPEDVVSEVDLPTGQLVGGLSAEKWCLAVYDTGLRLRLWSRLHHPLRVL